MSADPIYTLTDLDTWSFNGTPLAVLGHPIRHSVSPPMHNAALAQMALTDPRFISWKYFRFDIAPSDLFLALDKLRSAGFLGLNLTVPHKILACDYVQEITPEARQAGAINTLVNTHGQWVGHNTDGHGLAQAVTEDLQRELTGAHVILLGAGGAARGAAVECARRRSASLWIINRTAQTAHTLADLVKNIAPDLPVHVCSAADIATLPPNALVINATSAGLKPTDPLPIDLTTLPRPAAVFDMIYNPAETPFLAQARSLGIPAANGLSMLVHQGARALSLWTQSTVPVSAMRTAAQSALNTFV